ncbi:hypothetical protein ABW19_dt0200348 [Dactylella cylindrospora]|nr:hypothetical protein ABW19_dt0200348 [Dactylella cylindrospora]
MLTGVVVIEVSVSVPLLITLVLRLVIVSLVLSLGIDSVDDSSVCVALWLLMGMLDSSDVVAAEVAVSVEAPDVGDSVISVAAVAVPVIAVAVPVPVVAPLVGAAALSKVNRSE